MSAKSRSSPVRRAGCGSPRGKACDSRSMERGPQPDLAAGRSDGEEMKVIHVLETSAPELVGYTIRGRYIVNHQRKLGLDPVVITSPFFRGADARRIDEID